MKADFPVVLDACVLAEAAVSDLLLRLSEEPRLLLPKWTEAIWQETRRTWIEKLGWSEASADSRLFAAQECFPEAMISGYEHILPQCANHPDDRHVLAAAIHAKIDTIITFNVRDYPVEVLKPWGIVCHHPAAYLQILYDHDPAVVTSTLHSMAAKCKRTLPEMLGRLAWYVEPFSSYVAGELSVEIPNVTPKEWRR